MKRILLITTIFVMMLAKPVKADELLNVKATAYCYNSGKTATGTVPAEGRTLAGKPEWFGKTACLWEDKGNGVEAENYIGTFTVEDTGGEPIKKGYVVDVFIEDYEKAKKFGTKKVIMLLVDAEG